MTDPTITGGIRRNPPLKNHAPTSKPVADQSSHTEQNQKKAKALYDRGTELYKSGKYDAALSAFQEANKLIPHENAQKSIALCRKLLEKRQGSYELAYEGIKSQNKGQEEIALSLFQQAYELNPTPALKTQIERCEKKIQDKARADKLYNKGLALYDSGDYHEAMAVLAELNEIAPDPQTDRIINGCIREIKNNTAPIERAIVYQNGELILNTNKIDRAVREVEALIKQRVIEVDEEIKNSPAELIKYLSEHALKRGDQSIDLSGCFKYTVANEKKLNSMALAPLEPNNAFAGRIPKESYNLVKENRQEISKAAREHARELYSSGENFFRQGAAVRAKGEELFRNREYTAAAKEFEAAKKIYENAAFALKPSRELTPRLEISRAERYRINHAIYTAIQQSNAALRTDYEGLVLIDQYTLQKKEESPKDLSGTGTLSKSIQDLLDGI